MLSQVQKSNEKAASGSSTVVEHSSHQPKVKGSCLGAVTDTGREKMSNNQANSSSTMVEHSSHQPKVKGSCPGAVTGTGSEAMVKSMTNNKSISSCIVVKH